jgi:ParB-like chromosome segregation protein Spo0J
MDGYDEQGYPINPPKLPDHIEAGTGNPMADLDPDEYDALVLDIERRGQVYPIIVDQDGEIIDGHQRSRACAALGIGSNTMVIEVANQAERDLLAIALNVHRRHLSSSQRRQYILRLAQTGLPQVAIARAVGVQQPQVSKVISKAQGGVIPRNIPTEQATDKQGRTPQKRGGRPRKPTKLKPPYWQQVIEHLMLGDKGLTPATARNIAATALQWVQENPDADTRT